jgi:hypothetical protein
MSKTHFKAEFGTSDTKARQVCTQISRALSAMEQQSNTATALDSNPNPSANDTRLSRPTVCTHDLRRSQQQRDSGGKPCARERRRLAATARLGRQSVCARERHGSGQRPPPWPARARSSPRVWTRSALLRERARPGPAGARSSPRVARPWRARKEVEMRIWNGVFFLTPPCARSLSLWRAILLFRELESR